MNGIHDMGGMHGFGAVPDDDAQFHADWERRVYGMMYLLSAQGVFELDEFRYAIERMDPQRYLDTYFQRWLHAVATLAAENGDIDLDALDERARELAEADDAGDLDASVDEERAAELRDLAEKVYAVSGDFTREAQEPQFEAGDEVVVKNQHPAGHTRCPRYVRGKRGTINKHHGTHVFPDANAHGPEEARPLYSVRFEGSELWDGDTSTGAVSIDLWEPYLRAPE